MGRIPDSIKGKFELNSFRMKIPTDNTMYDCVECKEAVLNNEKENHKITSITIPYYGWVRICSGCGKMDGPWSHIPSNDDW